jgi:antitoxin (DNA-binding transcriptional repressor) of toxin-antitoxin stability system
MAVKEITLREANQQFSRLIREVEEKGETFFVLRNGKRTAKIGPTDEATRKLSPQQETALRRFVEAARASTGNSEGRRWTRDELYDRDDD